MELIAETSLNPLGWLPAQGIYSLFVGKLRPQENMECLKHTIRRTCSYWSASFIKAPMAHFSVITTNMQRKSKSSEEGLFIPIGFCPNLGRPRAWAKAAPPSLVFVTHRLLETSIYSTTGLILIRG